MRRFLSAKWKQKGRNDTKLSREREASGLTGRLDSGRGRKEVAPEEELPMIAPERVTGRICAKIVPTNSQQPFSNSIHGKGRLRYSFGLRPI